MTARTKKTTRTSKKKPKTTAKATKTKKKPLTIAEFQKLPVEQKIKKVRGVLATDVNLDPGSADYGSTKDVVVVERDSGIVGGLMVGYFFKNPAHLAAARWQARHHLEDVDLDELNDDVDLDAIDEVLTDHNLAGEELVFEGSVAELLSGDGGAEVRALWRARVDDYVDDDEEEEDEDADDDVVDDDPERPIGRSEKDDFLTFVRSGGLA
jgi:copper chaperone CopZ